MKEESTSEARPNYVQRKSEWEPNLKLVARSACLCRLTNTLSSGIDQTIVTIEISPKAKEFNVHRELLCQVSPYFRGAFKREFEEAQKLAIHLEDLTPRTFEIFQTWLYSGTLILPGDSTAFAELDNTADLCPECNTACEVPPGDHSEGFVKKTYYGDDILGLYIMADKYDTPLLRLEALITNQHLDERADTFPTWKMVSRAYENLPDNSPFGGYLVDMLRRYWTSDPPMCVCEPQSEREAAKRRSLRTSLLLLRSK